MKVSLLLSGLLILFEAEAGAQRRAGTSGLRLPPPAFHLPGTDGAFRPAPPPPAPAPSIGGFNSGFPVFVVEREVPVYVEKEVVREVPASVPTPGPSPEGEGKRKPYVIGASYASLPASCMKMIEEGVSFYYCSGEWYRQVGEGRSATYKAVARRL